MVAMVKDGEQSDVDLSAVSAHQAVGWTLHHPDVDPAAAPVEGQTRMVKAGRVRHVGVPVSAKHAAVAGVIKAKMEHNATQVALHEADGWAADPKLPAAEA
jgi:aryl-alcohol dehydrogenase-like predicted oxidoreductase